MIMIVDVIPHAAQSLQEIEIQALNYPDHNDQREFLQETCDDWSEMYARYVAQYPLNDPSDFILMIVGIRRLIERSSK